MKNSFASQVQATEAPERLNQYMQRTLTERGLSLRDVELRAAGKISYSLITTIAAGDFENLRFETFKALAKGLGVATERVFAVLINAPMPDFQEADFLVLYRKYKNLSDEEQTDLEDLIALLGREIERLLAGHYSPLDRSARFTTQPQSGNLFLLPEQESLKDYVRRLLKEKRLTLKEVERRSNRTISLTYLSNIIQNRGSNLTVGKIKALALGLGVAPQEILAVLEVHPICRRQAFQRSVFATLYHRYRALPADSKKALRLLLKFVDCEIDRRQMQQVRLAKLSTPARRGRAPVALSPYQE